MIIVTVEMKLNRMISGPFLYLKRRCSIKKIKMKITGSNAGYNKKLLMNSPCSKAMNERCIPQPGQSKPATSLNGQLNICS
jgi:hypothetical protein